MGDAEGGGGEGVAEGVGGREGSCYLGNNAPDHVHERHLRQICCSVLLSELHDQLLYVTELFSVSQCFTSTDLPVPNKQSRFCGP